MKDNTQYQIKDLYEKFGELKTSMNSGFERIEKKLDDFISAQAVREDGQDKEINDLKTKTAVQDTKQGMIATGVAIFSAIASFLAYYFPMKK